MKEIFDEQILKYYGIESNATHKFHSMVGKSCAFSFFGGGYHVFQNSTGKPICLVVCDLCKSTYKYHASPTNLIQHLSSSHKFEAGVEDIVVASDSQEATSRITPFGGAERRKNSNFILYFSRKKYRLYND